MKKKFKTFYSKLHQNNLFKDSFWAVSGNGIGYGLLLLASILIARFLGKEVYGEYGVVKTTMMYMASFAALGFGNTSTRFIARYISKREPYVKSVIKESTIITIISSVIMALTLIIGASPLAEYLKEPGLVISFRTLALIIICKAMSTTGIGILAGLEKFKQIGICNVVSGGTMLILCIPSTFWFGLTGALLALLFSQIILTLSIYSYIHKETKKLEAQKDISMWNTLLSFSFPIALQESSYTICNWGAILLLTSLSSVGEVGLYTAATQWNAIIMFIPGLLTNVVLSHLSSAGENISAHKHTIKLMLIVNLICTAIPFIIVYLATPLIVSFYGPTFKSMVGLMRITVFATIINSCINVFNSELMSWGRNWISFTLRFSRDIIILLLTYIILSYHHGINGAIDFTIVNLVMGIAYLLCISFLCIHHNKKRSISIENTI